MNDLFCLRFSVPFRRSDFLLCDWSWRHRVMSREQAIAAFERFAENYNMSSRRIVIEMYREAYDSLTCPVCDGDGKCPVTFVNPCPECHGQRWKQGPENSSWPLSRGKNNE